MILFIFVIPVLAEGSGVSPVGREYPHHSSDDLVKSETHEGIAVEEANASAGGFWNPVKIIFGVFF